MIYAYLYFKTVLHDYHISRRKENSKILKRSSLSNSTRYPTSSGNAVCLGIAVGALQYGWMAAWMDG